MEEYEPYIGPGTYGSWTQIDGLLTTIAATPDASGNVHLFGANSYGTIWTRQQISTYDGFNSSSISFGPWVQIDGLLSAVSAVTNLDGRMELFGINMYGQIFHRWEKHPGGNDWSAWEQIQGLLTSISAVRNADGRIEIFGVTAGGTLFHTWQARPGVNAWSDWQQLDGSWLTKVSTGVDADGRVELFGVNANGQVFRRAQQSAGSLAMTPWVQIDGTLRPN
jgi:hypothetical protein